MRERERERRFSAFGTSRERIERRERVCPRWSVWNHTTRRRRRTNFFLFFTFFTQTKRERKERRELSTYVFVRF